RGPYARGGLAEQGGSRGTRPLGGRGAEVRAEVTEPRRGEQGVGCGVGGDVGVGVPLETALAGPVQAREPQLALGALGGEGVDVDARADARGGHSAPSSAKSTWARARSRGVVIFMAASSPGTAHTVSPTPAAREASSVAAADSSSGAGAAWASSRVARSKPCGVCTTRRRERSS